MNSIAIRIIKESEAATYRTLRLKSFKEAPLAFSESYEDEQHRTVEDFAEELETKGQPEEWFVLGAYSDQNQLVGFVKFRRDQRSKAHHKAFIHAMYVDPDYRKHRIGKYLIDDLLTRIEKLNGLEQIHLWVLHADTSASDFYKKCGFESQGTRVKKDIKVGDVYVDAEYMVKYL